MSGEKTLGAIETQFTMLEICCDRCGRRGRLKASRLASIYGRKILLPDLAMRLADECPKRHSSIYERCSPYFPDLARRD